MSWNWACLQHLASHRVGQYCRFTWVIHFYTKVYRWEPAGLRSPCNFRCLYFRDSNDWDHTCHRSGRHHGLASSSCRSSAQCPAFTHVLLWGDPQRKPPEPFLQRDRRHWLHDPRWAEDDAGLPVQAAGDLHYCVVGHTDRRAGTLPSHLCLHLHTGKGFSWAFIIS